MIDGMSGNQSPLKQMPTLARGDRKQALTAAASWDQAPPAALHLARLHARQMPARLPWQPNHQSLTR